MQNCFCVLKVKPGDINARLWFVLAAISFFVPPSIAVGVEFSFIQDTEAAQSWLQKAKEAEARHDFAQAALFYTSYLKRYPNEPKILERLGLNYYLSNRFEAALVPLEQALKLDPTLWGAAVFLGISDYRTGRFEKALAPLRQALKIKPDLTTASYWLGSTLVALGRTQEAIAELEAIPPGSPESMEVDYLLVEAYRRAAETSYQRIAAITTDSYRLHQLQAESDVWKGKGQAAIAEYRRALEQKQNLEGAHRTIGDLYWEQGWFDLAAGEYEKEVQVTPLDDRSHLRLGEYSLSRGDVRRAIEHLQLSIRANPESGEAYRTLGEAWLAQGEFVKAESSLSSAVERDPSDPLSHQSLAEVYDRLGKPDLAEKERELFHTLSSAKAGSSLRTKDGSLEVEPSKKPEQ